MRGSIKSWICFNSYHRLTFRIALSVRINVVRMLPFIKIPEAERGIVIKQGNLSKFA